jgi:MATE family multidrug resistance protein
LGEGRPEELKISGNASFILVLIWMSIAAVLLISLRYVIPAFYVSESEVIELSAQLFIVAALFQIFDGMQVTALGALRGLEDVKVPTLIALLSYWIVALPVGYLLGIVFEIGAVGIWLGYVAGLILAAVLLYGRFKLLLSRITILK